MALGLRYWTALGVVCAACAGARLIAACSSDNNPAGDAATDQTVGCPTSNLTLCKGLCVDFTSDPDNCGMCGHSCGNGQTGHAGQNCVMGVCTQTCSGGSADCDGSCTDLLGDPNNCGGCGMKCASGFVCVDGGCGLSCQPGYDKCANDAGVTTCVDPMSNDYNCGMCGVTCGPGTRCEAGTCGLTCQANLTACAETTADGSTDNRCVNVLVDPNNCGSCGTVCEAGTFCSPTDDAGSDAACGLGCFGGTLLCSNRCVDPKIDPYNCGACNFVCDGGSPSCWDASCH